MKKTKTPKPRRRIIRLLPITVTMLSLLFIVKLNELYIGSQQLRDMYSARDAVAEDAKPAAEPAAKEAAAPAAKEGEPATAVKEGEIAAKPVDEKPAADAHGEPAAEGEEGGHGAPAKPPEDPKTFGTGKSTVKAIEEMKAKQAQPRYTQTELDLLQNLSKRREELDSRERELEIKSKVLEATDKRIGDKMNEMKTLQAELSKVLAQYNEKQDGQIKSLVKIYESMKPDEAAAIFNEMEMPILLEVIGKMSERKVAPVLANMSPKKAKDVTQELAEKRKKVQPAAGAAQ